MKKTVLVLALVLSIGLHICNSQVGAEGPNIILIMADDLGIECLTTYGTLDYRTPVLDNLASEGIKFNYCISQPLCTPSRVKIMTGKYNYQNYVDFGYLDVREKTFGNLMQEAGYRTMVAGKWQLNGANTKEANWEDLERPYQFGFDEYCLWWLTSKGSRYANPRITQNKEMLKTSADDYGPDIVSDYIVDFIGRNKSRPFFIYYPMMLVHSPFQPTPDSPEWKDPATRMKNDNKFFKDMVEYMDKIVGKIHAKLVAEGLDNKTIVMFTGDNGTNRDLVTNTVHGPYPGGKGTLLDNGYRVPFIVRWPASGQKGMVTDNLVEFSDFYPTLAEIAGATSTQSVGRSFLPLLKGEPFEARRIGVCALRSDHDRGRQTQRPICPQSGIINFTIQVNLCDAPPTGLRRKHWR